jgi:hypothetical protein
MPKTISLLLVEATLSLYPADVSGQPILTHPIWMGARAEGLELGGEIAEIEATPSGAAYDQFAQLSELHEISIERLWVLPTGTEAGPGAVTGGDYDLTRGQYVLHVFGLERFTGIWHRRTYYGVQAKRYGLRSNGIINFGSNQTFRAQYYVSGGGSSGQTGELVPDTATNPDQALLFTHDDPCVAQDYCIGFYQFSQAVLIGFTKAIAQAASATVLTLEINGALTAHTLTLPGGSGSVDDSDTFNVTVPANQSIRWKITTAGGAEYCGVTMNVQEV